MKLNNSSPIFEVIDLTWPAEEFHELSKWKLRKSLKGGKRVSAATSTETPAISDIEFAEDKMTSWRQEKLFMIRPDQNNLDEALKNRGYRLLIQQIFGAFPQKHCHYSKSTSDSFLNISSASHSKRAMDG